MEFELLTSPVAHDGYLFEWGVRDGGGLLTSGIEVFMESGWDYFAIRWTGGDGTGGYVNVVQNQLLVGAHYFIQWRMRNISPFPPIQTAYQATINGVDRPVFPIGHASAMLLPTAIAMVGRGLHMRIWQFRASATPAAYEQTGYAFPAASDDHMRFNLDEGEADLVHDRSIPAYNGIVAGTGWQWICVGIPHSDPRRA